MQKKPDEMCQEDKKDLALERNLIWNPERSRKAGATVVQNIFSSLISLFEERKMMKISAIFIKIKQLLAAIQK